MAGLSITTPGAIKRRAEGGGVHNFDTTETTGERERGKLPVKIEQQLAAHTRRFPG